MIFLYSPTKKTRRFSRSKETLLWGWVPGLNDAVNEGMVEPYMEGVFDAWLSRWPVAGRKRVKDSTYERSVAARKQIIFHEIMCRLDLWRQERQNIQYGPAFANGHLCPSISSNASAINGNVDVSAILATFSMLGASEPADLQSEVDPHPTPGSTCPVVVSNGNLVNKLSAWVETLQKSLNAEHATSNCSTCVGN